MNNWIAEIIGPVLSPNGNDISFRPQLPIDYPVLFGSDITGQQAGQLPDPSLVVWQVVISDVNLNMIENDNAYYVLVAEEIIEDA